MGISPRRGLGVRTATYSKDVVYHAASDIEVKVHMDSDGSAYIYVNTFSPPTGEKARSIAAGGAYSSISALVLKGEYWKVSCTIASPTIFVTPIFS